MKISPLVSLSFALAIGSAFAAPRLIVSTPSLVPESKIDVIFDQPMVAQEELGKLSENTLVSTDPKLPGKLFWKAPTIAEFRMDAMPEIGTAYHFSAGKNLKHLDGSAVTAGEFATVSSEAFRILSAQIPNRWSEDYSRATGSWMIVFNDDVDAATIAGFFSFSSEQNQPIAPKIEYATVEQAGYYRTNYLAWANRNDPEKQKMEMAADAPVKNILIVTPNSPLPVAKSWVLRVLKGLPNAGKSTTLGEDMAYEIGEVEPFQSGGVYAQISPKSPRRIAVVFNQPLPVDFPMDLINVEPLPKDLSVEIDGKTLYVNGDFSEDDQYTVSLGETIQSAQGQPLSNAGNFSIKFERLVPELALPSEDEAQLAFGLRKYAISTVNLSKVTIRIKKLSGKGLVRTYQGYRNYSGNGPDYEGIENTSALPYSMIPGETIVEKEIELGTGVDTGKVIELAWDELLPADSRYGALLVDVIGTPHPDSGSERKRTAQAIVQLTDVGLGWKFTDDSALVFAFSCQTGKALPGVKLALYGEDAEKKEEALTGPDGLATLSRNDLIRHLQASLGEDTYTVAFDKSIDQVSLWNFPVRYSWMKELPTKRRAFLFTERSLYRPGEKVRIKGIVRDQLGNAIALSKNSLARIAIIDPKEKEIFTRPIELSALGSFDLTFTLPAETVGEHLIKLEFPDDVKAAEETEDWEKQTALQASAIFSLPLRVEEFRRNTYEVTQEIDAPKIGAGNVSAQLEAKYYQGQPVAAGTTKTFSEITDTNPYPERYRDFLFGNHRINDWRYWFNYFGYRDQEDDNEVTQSSLESTQTLDADGKAAISLELPKSDFPSTREVRIATEVTDANNQTLTAKSAVTVHPASLYAGISRTDRLIRVGEKTPFRIVVTDTEGEPAKENVTLTATLTREIHTTTKTTNDNGEMVTESEPNEETVSTAEIVVPADASAKEGLPFSLTPLNPGLHFLTVEGKDAAGRDFATVSRFHVYGADEYPWQYEDGMRIKLVSEKKSYKPGDVARVLVLSPIEGTALVTIEREKVLSSYITEIKADNPVIEIPLTDDHAPNAYVSILIVKGSAESAREIKSPQLRLGYCELTIENQRDRLAVEISKPAESYRPGTDVTLTGAVNLADGKPAVGAEVTFYAVDEGTLAVMGYDTPDPMAFFYDPRSLAVDAGTSFHGFISENTEFRSFHNKGFFIGGGGDLSKLADLFRKNFDPCAAWAPTLLTDSTGNFSHTFKVPDTLTRYRVIAIAHHSGARFGHSESAIVVKKPLMLEPKLPRFANQGDLLSTQVMVQNASEHSATWEVTCAIGDGKGTALATIQGSPAQSVNLASGESSVLTFPIQIENTGSVKISFRAQPLSLRDGELTPDLTANLSDAVEETFEAEFPMPLLRQVKSLKLDPSETTDLRDFLSKDLATATGSIELDFATSPLVEIASSVDYLLQYPYGCAEQTSSSLMPWLAVKNLRPYIPAFAEKSDKEVRKAINIGVGRLLSMQQADGSFGYWPGVSGTNDWVTPYAGMALTLASQNGGSVPPSALESLSQYLIGSLRGAGDAKTSYELENHARSLYTLALLGKAQPAYHALMTERLSSMSDTARGLLAASIALGADGRPKVLASARAILTSKAKYQPLEDGGYWMPGDAATATDLIALIAIDPASKEVHATLDKLLNNRNPYGHWNSTWLNGWSLLAISQYAAANESHSNEPVKLTVETNDGPQEIMLSKDHPTQRLSLPLAPATAMKITTSSAVHLRMSVSGKPAIQPTAPVANNGLSIDRFYEKVLPSGQTEVLQHPKAGDLIRVTLRVTLPEDDSRYLVVDDPLPSIFETVNSEFASQSSGQNIRTSQDDWSISHSELRSDRASFFMDYVWKRGTYKITYLARCTLSGDVMAPPAKVESMYDPENFALSASQKLTVLSQ